MATRGIIAVYTGQGTWRGRYVHWDNYPHRIVPLLAELVERDGVAKVVDTIINKRESWSTIDTGEPRFELGYEKKNYEPGYGFFHSDGYMDIYTNDTGFYSWAQYVYVIDETNSAVQALRLCDRRRWRHRSQCCRRRTRNARTLRPLYMGRGEELPARPTGVRVTAAQARQASVCVSLQGSAYRGFFV